MGGVNEANPPSCFFKIKFLKIKIKNERMGLVSVDYPTTLLVIDTEIQISVDTDIGIGRLGAL